jgi:hypothetical protein
VIGNVEISISDSLYNCLGFEIGRMGGELTKMIWKKPPIPIQGWVSDLKCEINKLRREFDELRGRTLSAMIFKNWLMKFNNLKMNFRIERREGLMSVSAAGPYLNLDDLNEAIRNLNTLTQGAVEEFKEQPTLSIGLKYKISPKFAIGLGVESMPESEVSGEIYGGTSISQSISTIGGNLSFMSTISESKRHLLSVGIGLMYQEIKLYSNKDIELSDLVIKSTKGSASGFLLQGEFCLFPLGPFGLSIQGGYRLAPKIKLKDTMKADGDPITFDLGGVFYKGGLSWQF